MQVRVLNETTPFQPSSAQAEERSKKDGQCRQTRGGQSKFYCTNLRIEFFKKAFCFGAARAENKKRHDRVIEGERRADEDFWDSMKVVCHHLKFFRFFGGTKT